MALELRKLREISWNFSCSPSRLQQTIEGAAENAVFNEQDCED